MQVLTQRKAGRFVGIRITLQPPRWLRSLMRTRWWECRQRCRCCQSVQRMGWSEEILATRLAMVGEPVWVHSRAVTLWLVIDVVVSGAPRRPSWQGLMTWRCRDVCPIGMDDGGWMASSELDALNVLECDRAVMDSADMDNVSVVPRCWNFATAKTQVQFRPQRSKRLENTSGGRVLHGNWGKNSS